MTPQDSSIDQIDGSCDHVAEKRTTRDLEDRRAISPRLAAILELDAVLIENPNRPLIRITMTNISTKGMSFQSPQPCKPNDRIMLLIPGINKTGRLVLCSARHCRKIENDLYQIGVEFLDALNMPRTIGPSRIPPKWLMPLGEKKH